MFNMRNIKVAGILEEDFKIVINKGSRDGIFPNHEFLIYEMGEEIRDPDTNISLGRIEIVKGKGKVHHIQDRITILESTEFEYDIETLSPSPLNTVSHFLKDKKEKKVKVKLPFDSPKIGDQVKITNLF